MCNKWKILPCFVCGLSGVLFCCICSLSFANTLAVWLFNFSPFSMFFGVGTSLLSSGLIQWHHKRIYFLRLTHTHNWIEDLLFGFDFSLFCWQLVQQQLHQCFYKQTSKQMPLNVDVKSKVSRIVRKTWIKSGPSEKNRERKECITT